MLRIGFAKDIHKLVDGKNLMLGGIHVPFNKGEEAHSDGDVVYHALGEAILGAFAKGDLGKHFPTNDPKYDNIDSGIILKEIKDMLDLEGYHLVNADISIEIEKPKLAPYIEDMRKKTAGILGVSIDSISIKANTNEGFGETGKGEAVVAYAIVLLEK